MAETAGNIQLPPDSTGTKLLTFGTLPSQPADVEAEGVAPINTSGNHVNPAESASATTPASTPYFNAALANTKQTVKAAAGRLWGYHLFNPGSSTVYVQFYDALAAAVTVGTTVPTWVFALPANSTSPFGVDNQLAVPVGFAAGLVIACTTTPTGAGAPASAVVATLFYI